MALKVGINGFGRIGRMAFRAISQDFAEDIEVVGINDLLDADYLAYMLKYDSVHGNFDGDISVDGGNMIVNGKTIRLTAERDPANLKWDEIGADLVLDASGGDSFTDLYGAARFRQIVAPIILYCLCQPLSKRICPINKRSVVRSRESQ